MALTQQTLKKWQLSVTLLLGFLCLSLQAVPHSLDSRLGTTRFASEIASAQFSEFAEDLIGEDRLLKLRLVLEITLRETGDPIAFTNPFRFSTKYVDIESGHLNYGHRLYNPTTGRWLSKDPIEEDGGLNLYGFVLNNAINAYDILGLADDENYEPYSLIELGRLDRQAPSFYNDVERDLYEEGLPALKDYTWTIFPWGRLGRWADDAWRDGRAGATAVAKKGKDAVGWFKERFRRTPRTTIGFAEGTAESALVGMRKGGGHAIRHLEGVLIPDKGSLETRLEAFRKLATPILENPVHSADWRMGGTPGRAFLGAVDLLTHK